MTFYIAQSVEARHFGVEATVVFDIETTDKEAPSPVSLDAEGTSFIFGRRGTYRFDFFASLIPYTDPESFLIRFESPAFSAALQESFATTRVEAPLARGKCALQASTILPLERGQVLSVKIHSADKFILEDGARLLVTGLKETGRS